MEQTKKTSINKTFTAEMSHPTHPVLINQSVKAFTKSNDDLDQKCTNWRIEIQKKSRVLSFEMSDKLKFESNTTKSIFYTK